MRSAVILAGGGSRRLGREKARLEFDGKPLLCWTIERLRLAADEVIVVARSEEHAGRLSEFIGCGEGIAFAWDSVAGFGPVAGLDAGMSRAGGDLVFATACDLPFLSPTVVEVLFSLAEENEGYDAAVPQHPNGYVEPLHSVYRRERMVSACRKAIQSGERRIRSPLMELCINHVPVERLQSLDSKLLTFFNLNTPEDLERARVLWPKRINQTPFNQTPSQSM
ncbi:MAG: molybdenum cofactor guanylyltransferase [Methanothrix sp.]|nr:molybdenum cofactor guanylyltransferase [Methanothrix sp.]